MLAAVMASDINWDPDRSTKCGTDCWRDHKNGRGDGQDNHSKNNARRRCRSLRLNTRRRRGHRGQQHQCGGQDAWRCAHHTAKFRRHNYL
ncbi:GH21952 [Drosophila grimshawi]|uniref:GH21952 n=1 Tax=Drosophila grimshawi TaxID=7222 RepID=B4J8S2_DROGR|nr:GH21952 [Drosophila grimshawi]